MKIEQVMSKNVASCFPEDSIQDAARLMDAEGTGSLVVLDSGPARHVVGMISDRDVCLAYARSDAGQAEPTVRSVMSSPVHCCRPDDALWELLAMADTHRVRRFPVIDGGGQLLGVVSLNDAAREVARHHSGIPTLSAHEVCRAIAICTRGATAETLQLGR